MAILELRQIAKNFGGLRAIDRLDLEVHRGEILGVIGPNGSGKTTLFNIITGVFAPTSGQVVFDGIDITGWRPHQIAQLGLIRSFQLTALYPEFSVIQNALVAKHMEAKVGFWGALLNTPGRRKRDLEMRDKAEHILELAELRPFQEQLAATLSYGWQRSVVLAIALAANPKLLLLDEPVTALAPGRVQAIMDLLARIRERGTTVAIVEHNLRAIMGCCDRIVVMNFGRKIAEGKPEEIRDNPEVIEAYLGRQT